jgi:hypothetical protein
MVVQAVDRLDGALQKAAVAVLLVKETMVVVVKVKVQTLVAVAVMEVLVV